MKDATRFGLITSGAGLLFWGAVAAVACTSRQPTPQEKSAAAETTYTAEMLKCVDNAKTLEESRACRQRVREKWGTSDAGKDGGLNER